MNAVEWMPGRRSVCIYCGVGPAPLTASVRHTRHDSPSNSGLFGAARAGRRFVSLAHLQNSVTWHFPVAVWRHPVCGWRRHSARFSRFVLPPRARHPCSLGSSKASRCSGPIPIQPKSHVCWSCIGGLGVGTDHREPMELWICPAPPSDLPRQSRSL